MPVGLVETPVGFVDPACPVAWEHPLNRGLVNWWGGIPNCGWIAGLLVRDLVRGGKKPTDTGLGGSTWKGQSLLLSSTDTVTCSVPSTVLSSGFTLFYDLIPSVSAGSGSFEYLSQYGGSSENIGISFGHSNSVYRGACWMAGSGAYPVVTWSNFPTAGNRCQIGMSWNGSTIYAYVNGIPQGSVANNTFGSVTSQTLAYGGDGVLGRYVGGTYISVRVYSRLLLASEHAALVQQSKRGNPETLRWVGATTYGIPDQATPTTGGTPIFNSGILSSRIISGGGIVA